jgi:hypothetical protein
LTAIGEHIAEQLDDVADRFERRIARTQKALMDAVEARFAVLEEQLKTVESRTRGQFQFAREKDASADAGSSETEKDPSRRQLN